MCRLCAGKKIILDGVSPNTKGKHATLYRFNGAVFMVDIDEYKKEGVFEFDYCPQCGQKLANS